MTDWALFLGRFHPLVLHFPIGLLSGAFLLTIAARIPAFARYASAAGVVLRLGAIGAVLAAILGYLLALEGGYDDRLVGLHRWTGIATAVVALALVWLERRPERPRWYVPLFAAGMVLMGWAGHLGGTLTHGSGYLLAHAPAPIRSLLGAGPPAGDRAVVVEDLERAVVLGDLIMPVFDESCTECHNPIKRKSDLDLTTFEGLYAGGEHGPAVSEDGALSSELFRRLILPAEHEEAMPPPGQPRLTPADVELIGWWLDEGSPTDATVAGLDPDDRLLRLLRERFGRPNPLARLRIGPASPRRIARASRGAFDVEPVSEAGPYLRARLRPGFDDGRPSLDALKGVREQLVELDVGDSAFDDEAAAELATFEHLQRLALQNTAVTDAVLRHVADLAYLQQLNIHGTDVTDEGLAGLHGLEHLERVYAWNSGITEAGMSEAIAALPRLQIDVGVDSTRFAATQLPAPTITVDSALFVRRATVSLGGSIPGTTVHYTLDGSLPTSAATIYAEPFVVSRTARVRAVGLKDGWSASPIAEAAILQRGFVPETIRLGTPPNADYPASGASTLMDGILGTLTFRSSRWLGYRETDLVATVDLGRIETVGTLTVGILETTESWIFPPTSLDVSLSTDGTSFLPTASARYEPPSGSRSPSQTFLTESFEPAEARWVRVRLRNLKRLPDWHPGAGEPAWLFVDEILVGPGSE